MIRERRIVKQPEQYVIPSICYPRKRKKYKKRPTEKCEFIYIPYPLKFVCDQNYYPLYGECCLGEGEGTLITGTKLVNSYMNCRGIDVSNEKHNRTISLVFEKRLDFELPPWQFMVEKLQESTNSEYREWAQIIEKFCLNYENMMRSRSSNMINIRGYEEEKLRALADQSDKLLAEKFEKHPCLYFKAEILNNAVKFSTIEMNEKYVHELGYTMDTLATTTLNEGCPQLVPEGSKPYDKLYFSNYFCPNASFKELPESVLLMPTKSGFIRRMKCKAIFLPRMGDKTFYMSMLVILMGEEKEAKQESGSVCKLNKVFLERMIKKEKQSQMFLDKYYQGEKMTGFYSNVNKFCQIKELESDVIEDDKAEKCEF